MEPPKLRARRDRPSPGRLIESAAGAMVAVSMLLGGLSALALLGLYLVGPALSRRRF